MSDAPTSAAVPDTHPPAFYFFFWGEFAERCSYYGMRAVLIIYLTAVLGLPDKQATEYYSYFKAACYFLPLLGGFIADRYLGKYWTIVGFSIPYVIGQFLLAVPDRSVMLFALILLACGSGVIKPNISTLLGLTYDQKRPGRLALRTSAFQWFYFSVNIGAMVSLYFLPDLRERLAGSYRSPYEGMSAAAAAAALALPLPDVTALTSVAYLSKKHSDMAYSYAYPYVFMVPAFLMVAALLAFALGKRHYAVEEIGVKRHTTPEERAQQRAVLVKLLGLFALMSFFWMAYEHNDTIWVLFARDHMDTTLRLGGFTKEFAPDGLQFINAVGVLVCIPLFDYFFRRMDPEAKRIRPTQKMFVGFVITALSAGVMALAARQAAAGDKPGVWWLIGAYVVLTIGEVLIYGTGLELAFSAAPANMKGFITACFLLTNTAGNLINSQFTKLYNAKATADPTSFQLLPTDFFLLTMGITLLACVAFYFVGRRFNR